MSSAANAASYDYTAHYTHVGTPALTDAQSDAQLQADTVSCDGTVGVQRAAPSASYRGCMLAHGWNHAFGGGKIAGTTRWFASIGMRPAWVHAYVATLTEIGCGVLLLLGLLTPLAAGGVLGTMLVALVTAHLKNGFFIFRPGQGYEYVLMICVVAVALAGTGAGWLSLDHVAGYPVGGWAAYAVCVGAGGLGAALTLLTSWRPDPPVTEPAATEEGAEPAAA